MNIFKLIKEKINDKREEAEFRRYAKREARKQALNESKKEMIEMYKKKEKDKILGKKDGEKKDWLKKLSDGFGGDNMSLPSSEKVADMLGGTSRKKDKKNDKEFDAGKKVEEMLD